MQNGLTALGHGDLAWAGYFDNVRNRLGFYDGSLSDANLQGPLAYLVCGWYADANSDPLGSAKVTSLAAFNAEMQALGWQLDAGQLAEVALQRRTYFDVVSQIGLAIETPSANAEFTTTGNWWPSATVLHGAVVGIDWPGAADTAEVGGPPDPASIVVAAGDTMAETLATLIARANDDPTQAPIVEALQLGVLAELDQPDGRAARRTAARHVLCQPIGRRCDHRAGHDRAERSADSAAGQSGNAKSRRLRAATGRRRFRLGVR
jgi:hypothetical protein